MKLFESTHDFHYAWEQVTAANWQKYPNELSTHVVSVDILSRSLNKDTQVLRTERLIGCKQPIPGWITAMVGAQDLSYVREISEVDLINKTLVMKSHNLTMNHLLQVHETVMYRPNLQSPSTSTQFIQQAEITAFTSFSRVCDKIEDWSVERFGQNARTGKKAFELVLDSLTDKWEESGVFTSQLLEDLNQVSHKTTSVLQEVTRLGVFK